MPASLHEVNLRLVIFVSVQFQLYSDLCRIFPVMSRCKDVLFENQLSQQTTLDLRILQQYNILYKFPILLDGVEPVQDTADDETADGLSAGFTGSGYLQLPRSFANWLRRGGANFEITTTASDGLILYHGGKEDTTTSDSEFVAIAVQDGYIEAR